MKKTIIYATILLIVAIITISGTYAFFSASVTTKDPLSSETHQLEVIYTGDTEINGGLYLVTDKSGGYRREVSIKRTENSIGAKANIYINIGEITSALASDALNWEIYKIENNVEVEYDKGTFVDCGQPNETKTKCAAGKKIYMVTDLELLTTPQKFAIYIWLNGYKAGNEVLGAKLKGYIGAETETITGILE